MAREGPEEDEPEAGPAAVGEDLGHEDGLGGKVVADQNVEKIAVTDLLEREEVEEENLDEDQGAHLE